MNLTSFYPCVYGYIYVAHTFLYVHTLHQNKGFGWVIQETAASDNIQLNFISFSRTLNIYCGLCSIYIGCTCAILHGRHLFVFDAPLHISDKGLELSGSTLSIWSDIVEHLRMILPRPKLPIFIILIRFDIDFETWNSKNLTWAG